MIKIGPISLSWRPKKVTSTDWQLDETPSAAEEGYHFKYPNLLVSSEDTRDVLDNINYAQDITEKKRFAKFSYDISRPWVWMLVLVVAGQGLKIFDLEKEEFISVVTTTTASVLGISYIVGRYLFGQVAPKSNNLTPISSSKSTAKKPSSTNANKTNLGLANL